MNRRRGIRTIMLMCFVLLLSLSMGTFGGSYGNEQVAKAQSILAINTVDESTDENRIKNMKKTYDFILEHGTKDFFAGYPVDITFLTWVNRKFGSEAMYDIAYQLFEGNHNANLWYRYTKHSMHVLWLEYCKDMSYSTNQLEKIVWKEDTKDYCTVIQAVGDVSFATNWGTGEALSHRQGKIEECIDEEILGILQKDDITILNHEFTLTNSEDLVLYKGYNFKAKPEDVKYWERLDADLFALANNHIFDFKEQGMLDTIQTLRAAGYDTMGAGANLEEASEVKYYIINGKKIAFVNTSEIERTQHFTQAASNLQAGVFKCLDQAVLLQKIQEAERNADYTIVYIHWGFEGGLYPDDRMVHLATQMVEAGADAILGGHPHRLQGVDFIQGVPVAYSLGNFWFSSGSLYTTIAQILIDEEGELSLSFLPCIQREYYTSLITDVDQKKEFYEYLADISYDVGIDPNGRFYDIENSMDEVHPYAYVSGKNYKIHNPNLDLDGNLLDNAGNVR